MIIYLHRNTKNCKSKGTISIHKADKNYTWMYLTDYLNC